MAGFLLRCRRPSRRGSSLDMTDREHKAALPSLGDAADDAAAQGGDRLGERRSPGAVRRAYATSPFLAQLIAERLRGIGLAEARRHAPAINRAYAPGDTLRAGPCGGRLNLTI